MLIYITKQAFNVYILILALRVVSLWTSFPFPEALKKALSLVADPYLNLFSGVLPTISGLDIGSVIAIIVMSAVQALICMVVKGLLSK